MRSRFSTSVAPATSFRDTCVADKSRDDRCDADDGDWFARMAQAVLGHKTGTALHVITGHGERSCQRYAAGQAKPRACLLRALLRSAEGEPFLDHVMRGCTAAWWLKLQRARKIAGALDKID